MSFARIGKLKMKGAPSASLAARKKKKEQAEGEEKERDVVLKDEVVSHEAKAGTGMITTSGKTVYGNDDTKFREELQNGDTILIENPVFKTVEEKRVMLVLSSKSALLDEPFLEEYSSFVSFMIRKKPTVVKGDNLTEKFKEKMAEVGKTKGIKKEELKVRVRKSDWSYETKTVEVDSGLSREQLLDLREKMMQDKHCW